MTIFVYIGRIPVVCNQTGKKMAVPLNQLSRENGELFSKNELVDGDCVMYQDKEGKCYRVTIRLKKSTKVTGEFTHACMT